MSKDTMIMSEKALPEPGQPTETVISRFSSFQHTWRNIGLIIRREYKNRVAQRVFIISTIIMLALIIIGAFVPTIVQYIISSSSAPTKMVVVNNAGTVAGLDAAALAASINTTLNGSTDQTTGQLATGKQPFTITFQTADTLSALQNQVKNGSLNILLQLTRSTNEDLHFTYYTNLNATDDSNQPRIQALAQQLNILDTAHRQGLTSAQTSSLFAQPGFTVISSAQHQDTRSVSEIVAGYIMAYAGNILVYMAVMLYGLSVATGVAEEKGSRIMEILLNAATPFQLLAGKIIGIGAAGLTQMACIVAVGIGALLLQNPLHTAILGSGTGFSLDITSVYIVPLLLLLVYFILGFLLYATLFAAVGAIVKRQDEVQSAGQPIIFLLLIGYLVSYVGVYFPNTAWMKIISYVPFWTPTTMLVRVGVGTVAWWEIALTIVLMLATIFVCALFSARIYRQGVLMYGQKPGLRQLAKLIRMQ